jgi:hypothetical protein
VNQRARVGAFVSSVTTLSMGLDCAFTGYTTATNPNDGAYVIEQDTDDGRA